jgi:hypothetical protein
MHTPLTTLLQLAPGGVGSMVGENELFPPGVSAFCVSDTVADVVDVGVVVGAGPSSELLQPAVSAPITTRAVVPPASASRRIMRTLLMTSHLLPGAGRVPEAPHVGSA